MQRLETPYASNCTNSWKRTPFTELIGDFDGFEKEDTKDKPGVATTYNIGVTMFERTKQCTQNRML